MDLEQDRLDKMKKKVSEWVEAILVRQRLGIDDILSVIKEAYLSGRRDEYVFHKTMINDSYASQDQGGPQG